MDKVKISDQATGFVVCDKKVLLFLCYKAVPPKVLYKKYHTLRHLQSVKLNAWKVYCLDNK